MKYLHLLILASVIQISCNKDDGNEVAVDPNLPADSAKLEIAINYYVDQLSLISDSIMFQNAAGNSYSVRRLQYYLSRIQFIRSDSSVIQFKDFQYVDYVVPSTNLLKFQQLSGEHFIGIRFNIGLDSAQNVSYQLPATVENVNMVWPDAMGGGYHFLKLEGDFMDNTSKFGFAMHLGRNESLIKDITCWKSFDLSPASVKYLSLSMNVNEWFTNPSNYDFNVDPLYSMGNVTAMMKLKNNGADVFTLK